MSNDLGKVSGIATLQELIWHHMEDFKRQLNDQSSERTSTEFPTNSSTSSSPKRDSFCATR